MRSIRVLFLISSYGLGGFENRLERMVKIFDKRRFHIFVILVYPNYKAHLVSKKIRHKLSQFFNLKEKNIETVILTMKSRYDLSIILKVVRYIREKKIDVLFFFALGAGTFIAPIAGKLANVSSIIRASGTIPEGLYPCILRGLDRALIKMTDLIIVPSEFLMKKIVNDLKIDTQKIHVIPNGIDLDRFKQNFDKNAIRDKLEIQRNSNVVGMVANLTPVKAHSVLFYAIPDILKRFPNTHFLFLGDGILRKELEELGKHLNILSKIHFLGYRSDVEKVMTVFDVGVLCSKVEVHPNSLIEMMAAGIPVVATNVGGIPEIINHEVNGLLVSPNNPTALAQSIVKLLGNPGLARQYSENARQLVFKKFSKEKMVLDIQDIIFNLN